MRVALPGLGVWLDTHLVGHRHSIQRGSLQFRNIHTAVYIQAVSLDLSILRGVSSTALRPPTRWEACDQDGLYPETNKVQLQLVLGFCLKAGKIGCFLWLVNLEGLLCPSKASRAPVWRSLTCTPSASSADKLTGMRHHHYADSFNFQENWAFFAAYSTYKMFMGVPISSSISTNLD